MSRNRHTDRLQFSALLRWVILAAFIAVAGVSYLYLKNQLYVAGLRKKACEQQLRELIEQNHALDSQIAALTSRSALQQRLNEGFIKMAEIPSVAIVHLKILPHMGQARAIAAVTNEDSLKQN